MRGALVGLVVACLFAVGVFQSLEQLTVDARYTGRALWAGESVSPHILVIAIDEASLAELGRWPLHRRLHALLIQRLVDLGAAVIAFDILFESPFQPQADLELAQAIAHAGNVVLPVRGEVVQRRRSWSRTETVHTFDLVRPLQTLVAAPPAGFGHVNVLVDSDGVVRRIPWTLSVGADESEEGASSIEAISVAAVRKWAAATGRDVVLPEVHPDILGIVYRLDIGNHRAAAVAAERRLANGDNGDGANRGAPPRLAPSGLVTTVSYADVLAGRVGRQLVEGRIVFVGLTAPEREADRYLTPYGFGPVPGVFVHAAAAATLIHGPLVSRQAPWQTVLAIVAAGTVIGWLAGRFHPWRAAAVAVIAGAGWAAVTQMVFSRWGLLLDTVPPIIAAVGAYGWSVLDRYREETARRQEAWAALGRSVSPRVAAELLRLRNARPKLGGEKREVTVLFADLRGYTAFAEAEDAEAVVTVLNRYLTEMAQVVLACEGTLCKYTGDGVMALFGAPLPQEDHARRALAAAAGMRRRVRLLNERLSRRGETVFHLGVGIASGEAVVGYIGSLQRADYTAVGDVVNVAARLEDIAEPGSILASDATVEAALAAGPLGDWARDLALDGPIEQVTLWGRRAPVAIRRL